MQIRIDRGNGRPVSRQILDAIRGDIEAGRLAAGDRLPPIRSLAERLEVNRDTVAAVYERLVAEGLVESTVGRGTFVRAGKAAGRPEPGSFEPRLSPAVRRLLDLDRGRPRLATAADVAPLHTLIPDPGLYPVSDFRRAFSRTFASEGAALLAYGGPQGHGGLREILAGWLGASGIAVGPEDVVLCSGASQGISLALRLFAAPGDSVAVEEPTYHNVLATLLALDLRAVPVPMRGDGPDLAALERTLEQPQVKLFYTMPSFHNPLGVTTSLAHRRALLDVARRAGKPVVEDAFETDLRLSGRPQPSLAALDGSGLVVHLYSFSKSLFPGSRVGSIVVRGPALAGLLALKQATDLGGPLLVQAALAEFVRSGAYARHLGRVRKVMRSRRDALLESLECEMPEGVAWTKPEGGYQLWLELPAGFDSRDLLLDAARAGVLFAPGSQFHHDGRPSRGLRLAFGFADEPRIRSGIAALAGVVRQRLRAGPTRALETGVPV
jgi:DNA-binding transcriptional MocR family regulator